MLDAGVIDRTLDPEREGRRTLGDLCAHYGIELAHPHDAREDAVAAIEVLFVMATRYEALWNGDPVRLHAEQAAWHHVCTQQLDARRQSRGLPSIDPRDHVWPVPPAYPPAA